MAESMDGGADGGETKKPRRRKWLWVIAILALPLALGWSVWMCANARWEGAIQAEIERCRKAGQPFFPSDFDTPPIDDADNAAVALKQACEALSLTEVQKDIIDEFDPSQVQANASELAKIFDANAEALQLVRRARSMKGTDWRFTPSLSGLMPALQSQRALAKMLRAKATFTHKAGDDAEAIEYVQDMLAMGMALRKHPTLIGQLVAVAIDALACQTIEDVAPTLRIGPAQGRGSDSLGAADRRTVEALIGLLQDEEEMRKDTQRCYCGERAGMYEAVNKAVAGEMAIGELLGTRRRGIRESGPILLLRPWLKKGLYEMLRMYARLVEAGGKANWDEVKKLPPTPPIYTNKWERATHMFSALLMPSLNRAFVLHFRVVALRRMSAVALAIRLYEIDHGRRPDRLEDLTPHYLRELPRDPFGPPGRCISYRPAAKRPLLYSVGENETDEGGRYASDPELPPDYDNFDLPFFLNGDRPRKAPEASSPESRPASATRPAGVPQSHPVPG